MDCAVFPRAVATADLTLAVARMLSSPTIVIGRWEIEERLIGFGIGTAVYRVSGSATCNGNTRSWSLILKVVRPPFTGEAIALLGHAPPHWGATPAHSHYWRREYAAYMSGVLDDLGETIVAPRILGGTEHVSPPAIWLWLEDFSEHVKQWSMADYELAATRLGHFSAMWAARTLPSTPWLSRQFVRRYLQERATTFLQACDSPGTWEHPTVLRLLGTDARRLQMLFVRRETFFSKLESLPRTLAHFDAHQGNIFLNVHGSGATGLIDFSYIGLGAIGEELAPAVGLNLLLFQKQVEPKLLGEAMFERYFTGLKEAGGSPGRVTVRTAYAMSAALYVSALTFPLHSVMKLADPAITEAERDEKYARYAERLPLLCYLLDLAEEVSIITPD